MKDLDGWSACSLGARPVATVSRPAEGNRAIKLALLAAASLLLLFSGCKINPDPPDRYALVYGVSDYYGYYGTHDKDLEYTDDDAGALASLLKAKGFETYLRVDEGNFGGSPFYGFPDAEIEEASRDQFELDMNMLSGRASDEAIIFIFFSSHGMVGPEWAEDSEPERSVTAANEWIVTWASSATITSYADYDTYMVSDDFLAKNLRKLPTRKNVVVIDACLSGGFIGDSYDVDTAPADYSQSDDTIDGKLREAFKSYFNDSSNDATWRDAIVISAAGEDENSYEDPAIGNGIFTAGLLRAGSNDINNDGYISTIELYKYARDFVEKNFNDLYTDPTDYLPRISGGPVDYVLFEAD